MYSLLLFLMVDSQFSVYFDGGNAQKHATNSILNNEQIYSSLIKRKNYNNNNEKQWNVNEIKENYFFKQQQETNKKY